MNITVSGVGMTPFGEHWDASMPHLFRRAVDAALADAQLEPSAIDQVFVGTMLGGETAGQGQLGSLFATLYGVNIPGVRVEGACASGGLAMYHAVQALQSGACSTVLVVGIEKMTDLSPDTIAELLMQAASEEERLSGATFPSLYGLMAQAHMQEYGTTREDLAYASVIAHRNATRNPHAQFRNEISIEDVLSSAPVAEPLTLLDCSPITDGAAAVILTTKSSRRVTDARIVAQACTTDTLSLSQRQTLSGIPATQRASEQIFRSAKLTHADIDVLEVHDCFSIATLMALEDIGFGPKGTGGKMLRRMYDGDTTLPALNTSGGLKACGHPVGATGVKQIVEVALQLRGDGEGRQIKDARYGLTHNIGGTGSTCVMHLLTTAQPTT